MLALVVYGAPVAAAQTMLGKIEDVILFPLMTLMIAVALLVFIWGMFQYVANANNETAREEGKRHMLYGVIGFVVMVSALAILKIAAGTFQIQV
jgi:uncharacterized membrane protein YidH (DUF202 family)